MATQIPRPGKMVSVGSHRLHMIRYGEEKNELPTVVFDHGVGGSALIWSMVYPEIAKLTRVVIYDRAGYGWSEPGPLPRTNDECVEDLHELLKQANMNGPIILVGHSYGGLNARLYASRYPEGVRGIVLVDAPHEDELTDRFPIEHRKGQKISAKMFGVLGFFSRIGLLKPFVALKKIPGFTQTLNRFSPRVRNVLWKISFKYQALLASYSEYTHMYKGYKQVRDQESLGDIPLMIVVAGIFDQYAPGATSKVKDKIKQTLLKVAQETKKLSSRSKLMIANRSKHHIHIDQPEIVITAIKEILAINQSKKSGLH